MVVLDHNIIDKKIEAIEDAKRDLEKIVMQAAKTKIKAILQLQRDQLFEGYDGAGQTISPPYAESTIKRKQRKGQPYDRVTLKDEGDFYAGFEVEFSDTEFKIIGKDFKTGFLMKRYGVDILGLDQDSRAKLAAELKPIIEAIIFEKINSV